MGWRPGEAIAYIGCGGRRGAVVPIVGPRRPRLSFVVYVDDLDA